MFNGCSGVNVSVGRISATFSTFCPERDLARKAAPARGRPSPVRRPCYLVLALPSPQGYQPRLSEFHYKLVSALLVMLGGAFAGSRPCQVR